ncbi:MAG: leucine-rich repeat domain-containing protein [Clostridia bacterium]|nr:leucine-rich repeat domain-containing protein [Clostridia bacterium]
MRKTRKGFISVILIMTMFISTLPIVTSAEITESGTCGNNLTWTLDDEGTLTISGEGDMTDWDSYYNAPFASGPFDSNESKIKKIIIENGVTSIGKYAFYRCSNLTDITIPESVVTIGVESFEWCSSLTKIVLPSNLKVINDYAFHGCSSLSDISIPEGCTIIGTNAISGCQSLTNIFIPASVTSIGNSAFGGSYNLTGLEVSEENINYTSENGVLYNKDKTELLAYPSAEGDYTIPSGVKHIGDGAFASCKNLISITIPDSVISIENGAFTYCRNLTSINIPYSITSIGDVAFTYCDKLSNIDLPDSIVSIGVNAFADCHSLQHINIPKGMTHIADLTFYFCSDLKNVYIPKSITRVGESAFWCYQLSDVFYEGTEEQWNNIDIADMGNGNLKNATIHFNATGTKAPKFTLSANNGKLNFVLADTEYDSKMITVFSNGSIYNSFNLTDISAGDTSKQIDIPQDSKFAKVFIWDSLTGMKPLCEAQEIPIE